MRLAEIDHRLDGENMPGFSATPRRPADVNKFGSSWNMRPKPWPQKSRTTLMPAARQSLNGMADVAGRGAVHRGDTRIMAS